MDSGLEINARKLTKCGLLSTDKLQVRKIACSKRLRFRIMQISQTFGKNLLVQSHQFAGEKILTGKTLSPGTLLTIKIHGMNLLELMFPFIDTLYHLQFFLTEKILFQAQLYNYSFSCTDTVTVVL